MKTTVVLWVGFSLLVAGPVVAQPSPPAPQGLENYVWADACKTCHAAIHDSWAKTKHGKAIDRLGRDERKAGSSCVGCHLTGKEPLEVDGRLVNENVQCEACHGPGKAHVEATQAGNPATARMVKSPPESTCTVCHNDKSPHFRGFMFGALKGLVHKK